MLNPVESLKEYIRCASISAHPNAQEGMQSAREFLKKTFINIGFNVEIVTTPLHPIILAERKPNPQWPHVVIYGHYDVQPPEPLELWETPPFEPTIKGHHLIGRGSSDNKGPLMVHIAAVAKLLQEEPNIPLNLTFMIEGEEEIGSPSFSNFLENYKNRITGDFLFLSDTQSLSDTQLVITTGLRGLISLEVTVKGPEHDLHSGLYGGAIRNPIQALIEFLGPLHTPQGYVNIEGFYQGIIEPTDWEKTQIAKLDYSENSYKKNAHVSECFCVPNYKPWEATRLLPTLEYNGITGGYQGPGSKTIIPNQASVKITARLVPGQNPHHICDLITKKLYEKKIGINVEIKTYGVSNPYSVFPPKHPLFNSNHMNPLLIKAFNTTDEMIKNYFGHEPIYLKEGGSIPIIADIKAYTGMDALMIGLTDPHSRLHSPNENFNLHFLDKGIPTILNILKKLANHSI